MGVITGLMGSGKTTLLCHLFGMAPPDLYTSTGVAERSLRNHVFVDPQVPIELVNDIVRFRYKRFECVSAKQVNLLERGIITEDLLKCAEISSHFKKDIYEVKDAIKLFCHTFTLAPLEMDTAEREYLMMCLLPAIPDEELNDYIFHCIQRLHTESLTQIAIP